METITAVEEQQMVGHCRHARPAGTHGDINLLHPGFSHDATVS